MKRLVLKYSVPFKIRFHDFWPYFDPGSFILTRLLSEQLNGRVEIVKDLGLTVDLEVWSVFTFRSWKAKAQARALASRSELRLNDYNARALRGHRIHFPTKSKKRMWYTGENLRPPVGIFDATCSFDVADESSKNIYMPYWMTRLDHGLSSQSSQIYPTVDELMQPRKYSAKNISLCTFSSVQEPIRSGHLRALSKSEYFDEISAFGNLHKRWVENKQEAASEYLFQLCNENDHYPNYVTEKLQEAFMCGNIPIWSGLDTNQHFNRQAILDLTGLSTDAIIEKVRSISQMELIEMYEQPILNHSPDLGNISDQLTRWIIDL